MRKETLPPPELRLEGRDWTVERAWPAGERLAIEVAGHAGLRAGWWQHGRAGLLPAGRDPKLPDLAPAARRGTVVSHRAGKRAVVRRADGEAFTKVVRRGRAAGILAGIDRAAPFAGPFAVPEVIETGDSAVTFSRLPGTGLHDPSRWEPAQWRTAWREVLAAWAEAVFRHGAGPATPHHGVDEEVQVLRDWTRRVAPYLREDLTARLERVTGRLHRLDEAAPRPAHRDLHDKQLLWSPAGPGLLDVDTACLADPALDLGNLQAHVHLRRLQGVWPAERAGEVSAEIRATAIAAGVPEVRLLAYEQATRLRLGLVYAVRPRHASLAAALRAEL